MFSKSSLEKIMVKGGNRVLLTKEGLQKLKSEYKNLVSVKRLEVAAKIKKARELGDISENGEYDAAREEQAFVEGRIAELEEILRDVNVVDTPGKGGCVSVGSKVRVYMDGKEEEYHIVGGPEADPSKGKISHESPLGKALLGKKVGEKVQVDAPVGKLTLNIISVN